MRIAIVVLLLLLLISSWTGWYSARVSVPRYCDNPQQALQRLERVLRAPQSIGDSREARRDYLVAAKLLFLLPQQLDEDISAYLRRIDGHINLQCP